MEGLRWERTVLLSTPTMRTDFFRPMRRAVTDLSFARKRRNKGDTGLRSSRSNQVVPVVSVQYDVPKTPPSPMMYRYRRHHTPCATNSGPPQTQKNKTEEKQNIISHPIEFPLKLSARLEFEIKEERRLRQELKKQDHLANIDNHRIKGLGVGKLYSEYQPLPTSQGQDLVPPATAPAQVPVLEQMNNLSFSSPVSCYYGFQHASQGQGPGPGHGSIASIEPPSSTRAQKGSIHSPCHTSLSQYQQLSGSQAPTPDGFGFNKQGDSLAQYKKTKQKWI